MSQKQSGLVCNEQLDFIISRLLEISLFIFNVLSNIYIDSYILYIFIYIGRWWVWREIACKGFVTPLFSYAKRHNDAGVWGDITNDVLKFRKVIVIINLII